MHQIDNRIAQLENEILFLKKQLEQNQEEISKYKRNEKELQATKESESTLRKFFEHSADGIMLADSDGIIREWSSGCEQITGLEKESLTGKVHLWEMVAMLFPADTRPVEELQYIKVELTGLVRNMQQKMITCHIRHYVTGKHRVYTVFYFPVPMSGKMMLGGISRDVTEEVRSRKQLEENERILTVEKKRLESLSNNLPEGTLYRFIFNRDTEKRYMEYVSSTWEQVTGLTPESVADDIKAFDDIVHPEDLPRLVYANTLTTTNLSDYNVDVRISKKGKPRWLRIASHPYADGNQVIWDGIMTDITRRKEAERRQAVLIEVLQIVQSAENLTQAMNLSLAKIGEYAEVSRVHIYEKNTDGTSATCIYEWCNKDIQQSIKGLSLNIDSIQSGFDTFEAGGIINTPDIHTLHPKLAKTLDALGVKSTVCFPLSANGVIYGFVGFDEYTTTREWDQNEVELLKSLSQIISTTTYRYRAETVIRLSQQTMRTVLDNISANIFVVDMDTSIILFANKGNKKLVGNEFLEGKRCWEVMQTDKNGLCDFCFRPRLVDKNNCPTGVYYWEQFHELSGRWLAMASTAIEWIDGRLVHLEVSTDITDRKLSEMEIIRAKEKAEESDKLKSAFLANVSHEIRTPLNGIIGFLHFLSSDNLSTERRNGFIDVINNSSIQLMKLIDDIIDVAKIEAGQMIIRPAPIRIDELMNELQMFFETYIKANNKEHITMIFDNSEAVESCVTFVDPVRLRQVLGNLLNNAVKFTEKGFIRFAYRQSAPDLLEFVVEDSGIGLAPDHLEIIFERFRQADLNNSHQYGGTGLGLTISRSLVKLMGGKIWVESTEGAGSSFCFTVSYLPVAPEDEHIFAEPSPDEPTEGKFAGKTVLVAEPVLMKYKYYDKLISATGASVIHAQNLQQWLDVITQTNHIDMVIADASVFIDGSVANMNHIKNVRAGLPLILLLSGQKENYRQAIDDSQCTVTVETPVSYAEIVKMMEEYADGGQRGGQ